MPNFAYSGRTRGGETVSGERMADNADTVVALLRREQVMVTRIAPAKEKAAPEAKKGKLGKAANAKNLAVFTRQFSVMIDAGLPLVQCLEILGGQEEDKNFAETILATRSDVESGASLADAMKKHPRSFDPLFTNMIAAGEAGGILDTILKRLATYIEKNVKLKAQVKSAMIYPVAVIVIAVVVVGVILWKVIPTFAALFAGLGAQLPLPTRIVIALSDFLVNFMPFIIVGIVAIGYAFKSYYATTGGKYQIDGDHVEAARIGPADAEDRGGALLPDAVHADELGRAHSGRSRNYRTYRRQLCRRRGHSEDPQEHRTRRNHFRSPQGDRGVSADGDADGCRRRNDRRPRYDAGEDRRLL